MCTVSYFPLRGEHFILSSNRDETLKRPPSLKPALYSIGIQSLLFPKDPLASGTWIACSSEGRAHCLLNGGLISHKHSPPYRKSRGLVLLDAFQYADPEAFVKEYNLEGIEPFTLIMILKKPKLNLSEIRWTGKEKILKTLNPSLPAIWSSVTLYRPELRKKRENWFSDFLTEHPEPNKEMLFKFHQFGGEGDSDSDLVMNRPGRVRTQSITQVITDPGVEMAYADLLENTCSLTGYYASGN